MIGIKFESWYCFDLECNCVGVCVKWCYVVVCVVFDYNIGFLCFFCMDFIFDIGIVNGCLFEIDVIVLWCGNEVGDVVGLNYLCGYCCDVVWVKF